MRPQVPELLGEIRVIPELIAFAGDALVEGTGDFVTSKPVLLIPGFMASDAVLYPLAARLSRAGAKVFFAGIWCNAACPVRTMERLERALTRANRLTRAKVVIIGHSLGGIYARELARRQPQLVERAILLGAPVRHSVENSTLAVRALALAMEVVHHDCMASLGKPCPACGIDLPSSPPQVPETIIYTKSDGVVDWRSCLESGPHVETVEVKSSHCGLAANAQVLTAILKRLEEAPHGSRPKSQGHRIFGKRPSYLRLIGRSAPATAA